MKGSETEREPPDFETLTRSQLSYLEARSFHIVEEIRDERAELEMNLWYFVLMIAAFCLGFCWVSYLDAAKRARA